MAVDVNLDHFIKASNLLTSAQGETKADLAAQYGLAASELRSMAQELDGPIVGVPAETAAKVSAAARTTADGIEQAVKCYQGASSGSCDGIMKVVSEDANDLGFVAADLLPLGTRSGDEVLALLNYSAQPTPSPSTSASAGAIVFRYECDSGTYDIYAAAWAQQQEYCEAILVSGTPTQAQRTIAAHWAERPLAKLSDAKLAKEIASIAGFCAESGPDTYNYLTVDDVDRTSQVQEVMTMLEWCPDHPDAAQIKKRVAAIRKSMEGGRKIFSGGVLRVAKDIAPGTYVSRGNSEPCYWERLDRNGNIIDNNYTNGSRVQVTISPSDFEFNSDGCNTWKRA